MSQGTQGVSEAGKGENRFSISLEPPEGTGLADLDLSTSDSFQTSDIQNRKIKNLAV